jgi:aldehyde:ferredoxin oxidoreductase
MTRTSRPPIWESSICRRKPRWRSSGHDAVIIHAAAAHLVRLEIMAKTVQWNSAANLWGRGTFATKTPLNTASGKCARRSKNVLW